MRKKKFGFHSIKARILIVILTIEVLYSIVVIYSSATGSHSYTKFFADIAINSLMRNTANHAADALMDRKPDKIEPDFLTVLENNSYLVEIILTDPNGFIEYSTNLDYLNSKFEQLSRTPHTVWYTAEVENMSIKVHFLVKKDFIDQGFWLGVKSGIAPAIVGMFVVALAGLFISVPTSRRLNSATEAAARLRDQNYSTPIQVNGHDEVAYLASTLEQMRSTTLNHISELEQSQAKLLESNQQLDKVNKNKTNIFDMMSHEFRTLFNAILMASDETLEELLDSNGTLEPEVYHQLVKNMRDVQHAGTDLLSVFTSMLESSKAMDNRSDRLISHINIYDLVQEISLTIQREAQAKQHHVEIDCPKDINVYSEYNKLRDILMALCLNAIVFNNKPCEICIKVSTQYMMDVACYTFEVIDNGIGMSAKTLGAVRKDPFYKANMQNTSNIRGIGLGLYLSNLYAQQLNSQLTIMSRPGMGTHITLAMPIESTSRMAS